MHRSVAQRKASPSELYLRATRRQVSHELLPVVSPLNEKLEVPTPIIEIRG